MLIEEFDRNKHTLETVRDLLAMAVGNPTPERLRQLVDEFYTLGGHTLFVATDNNKIIGIVGIDHTKRPGGFITHLAVLSDARRQGIGRHLVNHTAEMIELAEIGVETDQDAVGFYDACGFKMTEIHSPWPGVHRFTGAKSKSGQREKLL